ncbi:MAG TPA: polyprenyl synthetase family protein [Ignavibacteriaceae bacterium]|nr:polyprenyl synthetase family protein [Ignavibacteriaceae bacterium]
MIGDKKDKFYFLYERERIKVEKKLEQLLQDRKPASLYLPGSYILRGGGKRLRPLLVLFSTKAVGGKLSSVYNAAVAVELLHNFTLVHDDIMDNADKRRGKLTLHKKYDVNTAILVGDSLLSVAYENLLKDCKDNAKPILEAFTKGLVEVCEGQSMDKDFESKRNISINDYILMIKKKTAAMAEMCCKIGSILGGGSSKDTRALSNFGKNIGIAFQIQDDLLDIIGDEKEFGKFVGGDLMEGKKTFLLLKAFEVAKGEDRKKLQRVIDRKGIKLDEILIYRELYKKLGVLDDAKTEIKRYTDKALMSVQVLQNNTDREFFTWLANSLIKRSK